MNESHQNYSGCQVLGVAIKRTARLMQPFIVENGDLQARVEAIQTQEDEQSWYSLSTLIELINLSFKNDVFEQLARATAANIIKAMAQFPGIDSPGKALETIARSFPMQHKGEVGSLVINLTGDTEAVIIDSTYCPCGYISWIANMAVAGYGGTNIEVDHDMEDCRKNGNIKCTYKLTWQ